MFQNSLGTEIIHNLLIICLLRPNLKYVQFDFFKNRIIYKVCLKYIVLQESKQQ